MNNPSTMTVAAAQYGVEFLGSWTNYTRKLERMVSEAAQQEAKLLLFPEYGCLDLASLFPADIYQDLHKQLNALQTLLADFIELHCTLAQQHNVYIVASSFPVRLNDGSFRNRAFYCTPAGRVDFQDKLIMTRFENEMWQIGAGDEVKVFDTPYGRLGITICYDAEFPLLARRQVEMGATIILAPSCTDTLAGFNRVRIGCRARALENQCYVVMSPVVGTGDWSPALGFNIGAAGIYTPVDEGFPSDGILAAGELNAAQWVIAELDLSKISAVRKNGEVLNHRDWDKQTIAISKFEFESEDAQREAQNTQLLVAHR
ncbi:MAG: carbon-nitrogen hydrolase family protein [Chloroflexota bacterium]|nr:carbon-nitrogen hydrolase family protein [Chloroflexota bacterium]